MAGDAALVLPSTVHVECGRWARATRNESKQVKKALAIPKGYFLFSNIDDAMTILVTLLLWLMILFLRGCSIPVLALSLLSAGFSFMQTLAFISAAVCTVWYLKPHLLQSFCFVL